MAERYEKHKVEQKLADKVQLNNRSSASLSSSDSEDEKKMTSSFKSKIPRLFGRDQPIHKVFGGGKHFNVEGNGLHGLALYEQGFAHCWSGCQANTGIMGGKYCFGCKIASDQPVEMEEPLNLHLCCIGISGGERDVLTGFSTGEH